MIYSVLTDNLKISNREKRKTPSLTSVLSEGGDWNFIYLSISFLTYPPGSPHPERSEGWG